MIEHTEFLKKLALLKLLIILDSNFKKPLKTRKAMARTCDQISPALSIDVDDFLSF